jgi:hypothetical protein
MARKTLERYREAAKEIRRHLDSQKYRTRSPERAFVEWYILARFGENIGPRMLDGKKDGGIDALVENDGKLFVIQSKYEVRPKVGLVTRNEIAGFEKIATNFCDEDAEAQFIHWLQTVRVQLRATYKNIRKRALRKRGDVRFIFVTTKRFQLEESGSVEIEEIQKVSSLWYLYSEGFTPPTEFIELSLESAWHTSSENNDFKTYVGLAEVRDFLRLMDDDKNERLFAQNVRTDLRSTINREIRTTYERDAGRFWLGNNGIYIVCKKVTPSGNTYRLVYPSIINGSQTLHTIYSSPKRHSCAILVRILEMDVVGNPGLLSSVIRRTNTQNPMKLINLSAHDQFQLNVARYLDRYKIFYERREKEWINEKKVVLVDYYPVRTKETAQWLSTLHVDIGLGRARSNVSELFQDKFYEQIFGNFDLELKSRKYSELANVMWAGLFVKNLLRKLPVKRRAFAKMSQLLLVRLVAEAIRNHGDLGKATEDMLSQHRFGHQHIPNPLIRPIKNIVANFIQIQKKAQDRDPNIDFSNFFKRDDLSRNAYRKYCTPKAIKRFSTLLVNHMEAVE